MIQYESGFFEEAVPYLKLGHGEKTAVIFPPTTDLICSLSKDPKSQVQRYSKFFPPNYTIFILGYDPNLPKDATAEGTAEKFGRIIKDNIGKAMIVGISYGGCVAIPFAAKFPELVEKLLLIVTAYTFSEKSGLAFLEQVISFADKGDHYGVAKTINNLWNVWILRKIIGIITWANRKKLRTRWNPLSTVSNAYKDVIRIGKEYEKFLPQIQAPVFVFGGTRDKIFSEEIYRETTELCPNGSLILFKGAGHMVAIERRKDFKRRLWEVS